jgi:hypothetical protein
MVLRRPLLKMHSVEQRCIVREAKEPDSASPGYAPHAAAHWLPVSSLLQAGATGLPEESIYLLLSDRQELFYYDRDSNQRNSRTSLQITRLCDINL